MMRRIILTAIILLGAFCAPAPAQATQSAGASVEQKALTPNNSFSFASPRHGGGSSDFLSFSQMISALFIVLSVIFAAKWAVPKIWPAVVAQKNGAVRILSRTHVSPKNQIVLVQVGNRVLVLGENASQLSTLSTIDDTNEIAMLIGKAGARIEREADRETPFAAALEQSNRAYSSEPPVNVADQPAAEVTTSGELSDLIGKVRSLARQLGRQ